MRNHSLAKKLAAAGMFAVLGIASVGTVVSFASGTATSTEAKPEKPEHNGRYMGKITAIDSSSPDNSQLPDGMHGTRTMTFTTSTSYASDFAVGDMVEVLSADGETADGVSAAEKPEKKDAE